MLLKEKREPLRYRQLLLADQKLPAGSMTQATQTFLATTTNSGGGGGSGAYTAGPWFLSALQYCGRDENMRRKAKRELHGSAQEAKSCMASAFSGHGQPRMSSPSRILLRRCCMLPPSCYMLPP